MQSFRTFSKTRRNKIIEQCNNALKRCTYNKCANGSLEFHERKKIESYVDLRMLFIRSSSFSSYSSLFFFHSMTELALNSNRCSEYFRLRLSPSLSLSLFLSPALFSCMMDEVALWFFVLLVVIALFGYFITGSVHQRIALDADALSHYGL